MRVNHRILLLIAGCVVIGPSWHTNIEAQNEQTIEITAKRFGFSPAEVTVKRGQAVTLILTTKDVSHGVRFRDLNLNLRADKNKPGQTTFTPEKTGDFVGHCSVFCGSGHGSMQLTIHVIE